mmetsp:Transcript_28086/g.49198  ORF Transcript_28086/g.49198 Transcript_28086/m.49198 type:complete len:261 (+) Transcript_28086:333-1115(+)
MPAAGAEARAARAQLPLVVRPEAELPRAEGDEDAGERVEEQPEHALPAGARGEEELRAVPVPQADERRLRQVGGGEQLPVGAEGERGDAGGVRALEEGLRAHRRRVPHADRRLRAELPRRAQLPVGVEGEAADLGGVLAVEPLPRRAVERGDDRRGADVVHQLAEGGDVHVGAAVEGAHAVDPLRHQSLERRRLARRAPLVGGRPQPAEPRAEALEAALRHDVVEGEQRACSGERGERHRVLRLECRQRRARRPRRLRDR